MLRNPNPSVIAVALLAVVLAVFAGVGYSAPGGNGDGQGQGKGGRQVTTTSSTPTTTTSATATATNTSASTNGGGSPSRGRGQGDPSCSASPNPAVVGQSFTLSAIDLPTTDMVWLIVSGPGGSSLTQVFPNPDGSWSGSELASQAGVWSFAFSGPMSNNKYGTVASCTEQVDSSGLQ